jgi:hypothetical protein
MAQLPLLDVTEHAADENVKVGPDVIKITAAVKGIIASNNDLDTKVASLLTLLSEGTPDADNLVNRFTEVLQVLSTMPEGADVE